MKRFFGETFKSFQHTGFIDDKGRPIGYIIGLCDNKAYFHAWVQNARFNGDCWKGFGLPERSRKFKSRDKATNWAYATIRERISKLKNG